MRRLKFLYHFSTRKFYQTTPIYPDSSDYQVELKKKNIRLQKQLRKGDQIEFMNKKFLFESLTGEKYPKSKDLTRQKKKKLKEGKSKQQIALEIAELIQKYIPKEYDMHELKQKLNAEQYQEKLTHQQNLYLNQILSLMKTLSLQSQPQLLLYLKQSFILKKSKNILQNIQAEVLAKVIQEMLAKKQELIFNKKHQKHVPITKTPFTQKYVLNKQTLQKNQYSSTDSIQLDTNQLKKLAQEKATFQFNKQFQQSQKEIQNAKDPIMKIYEDDVNFPNSQPVQVMEQKLLQFPDDYDLMFDRRYLYEFQKCSKDELIKKRIVEKIKLKYFRRKINAIQKQNNIDDLMVSPQDDPLDIDLLGLENYHSQITKIARQYNMFHQLLDPISPSTIFKQVQMLIDHSPVYIAEVRHNDQANSNITFYSEFMQNQPSSQDLLWTNLATQTTFSSTLGMNLSSAQNVQIEKVSPHAKYELSLSSIPFKLHHHPLIKNLRRISELSKIQNTNYRGQLRSFQPQQRIQRYQQTWNQQFKQKANTAKNTTLFSGYAKRKTSRANCTITQGNGKVIANGIGLQEYFDCPLNRGQAIEIMLLTQTSNSINVNFKIRGGGKDTQAQACQKALGKALIKKFSEYGRQIGRCKN